MTIAEVFWRNQQSLEEHNGEKMINMRIVGVALMVAYASMSCAPAFALPSDTKWFVGFWKLTHDEDGTPADTMEFRADGTYINRNYQCRASSARYHVYNGDIYVTLAIPGKGPIAIVFHPNADRTKLTFTSPRSRNNATYEPLSSDPCQRS